MAKPNRDEDRNTTHLHAVLLGRVLSTIAGRAAVLVASFAFAIAAARLLELSQRGEFALLQSLNGLTLVGVNFAIQSMIIRAIGRRQLDYGRAVGAAIILGTLCSALGALIAIPACYALRDTLFESIDFRLVIAAILLTAPLVVREYLGGPMIAAGKPLTYVVSHAIQPIATLAALPLGATMLDDPFAAVVVAWACGTIASSGYLIATAIQRFRPLSFGVRELLTLARSGIGAYPAMVTRFLNLRLDQFLVATLASTTALGIYAVAVNVSELLLQIPAAMLWGISGAIADADEEVSSHEIVERFCRWALLILFVASLVIAIAAPVVVPIVFGEAYESSVRAIWAMLPGMIFHGPALIISEYFMVRRGLPSRSVAIFLTSVVISLLFNAVLTPQLGALGAGIACSVSYGAMLVVASASFIRDTGVSWRRLFIVSTRDLGMLRDLPGVIRQARSTPSASGRDATTLGL